MHFQDFRIGVKLAIGFSAVMLIIVLIVALNIVETRKSANLSARILTLRVPTAASSSKMNTGIKYALAALRGWILLGEEKFKKEREEAWEQYIHPSLGRMRELSQNWTNPENVARLKEVEKLLKEFE